MNPPRWQDSGKDPDYRFSLANERTFPAWIRTALAILAGALLLHQLAGTGHALSLRLRGLVSSGRTRRGSFITLPSKLKSQMQIGGC